MSTDTHFSETPASPQRSAGVGKGEQSVGAQKIRALFVSDIHLGSKHTQAGEFFKLLEQFEPETLYIVGDFVDGWKLKRRWRWLPVYDQIIQRLMTLKKSGTQLKYVAGNHDSFLRGFFANYGVIDTQDRFIHEAADGRRYLVIHGDQFDQVEQKAQWLSLTASYFYDFLLSLNKLVNKLRGKKQDPYALCGTVKRRVKSIVKHVSDFETLLVQDAIDSHCDGVICGHLHTPRIEQLEKIQYLNTGDWVENCSALIELSDGSFELLLHGSKSIGQLAALPALPAAADAPQVTPAKQVAENPSAKSSATKCSVAESPTDNQAVVTSR